MSKIIQTPLAPKAIGPYVQAIQCDSMLFISGQLPINPENMAVDEGIEAQTTRCLTHIFSIVEAAGFPRSSIVKLTVYMQDLSQFTEMNRAYESCLAGHRPTRSTVEVARLPKDVLIEIDAICHQ
ncbi:MAG: Rid family detoxifying hydrolase [Candidatus Izemoplasmatales bacterium]|nr:Rid family detoxifying hydrolase [Candidatus Izemoplasmatales bacterium]MDD5293168.1 Rid family detoxifying hydrolase [Candidatus Izemoplasmatales bacterium]